MKTEAGKVLNMIRANEAGVSIYIYEDEHERRIIEIHGVVNDHETALATATIEKHNRDNFAETISTNDMRLSATEAARLADAAATGAATSMRSLCVEKVKGLWTTRRGNEYNGALNDALREIEALTLDQVEQKHK